MSHPVTLLPWYQNGTLSEAERAEVAAHLEACTECRAELESLSDVRHQMRAALESDAAPSPAARRRVMRNIAPQPQSGGIGEVLRNLFAMKWVPAAAMGLIVLQSGVLLWTLREPSALPGPSAQPLDPTTQPDPTTTRRVGMQTAKLRVQFAPTAREADIRALLTQVLGKIVGGPSADGEYTVEVVAANAERAATMAATMRERADVVRSAEPVAQ